MHGWTVYLLKGGCQVMETSPDWLLISMIYDTFKLLGRGREKERKAKAQAVEDGRTVKCLIKQTNCIKVLLTKETLFVNRVRRMSDGSRLNGQVCYWLSFAKAEFLPLAAYLPNV